VQQISEGGQGGTRSLTGGHDHLFVWSVRDVPGSEDAAHPGVQLPVNPYLATIVCFQKIKGEIRVG